MHHAEYEFFISIIDANFYFVLLSYWKLWKKYCHLFPSKNYLLIAQENDKWLQIVLINRAVCLKKISENISLFRQKLYFNLSVAEIFDKITGKDLFQNSLNNNQALCGILYGYEKENCLKFEKIYSTGFISAQKSESFHQEHPLSPLKLKLPYFVVFAKDQEIDQLKRDYAFQRNLILNTYNNGQFFEMSLQKLVK